MSDGNRSAAAYFWLPVGFLVAVIDAWLSIQSIVGVIDPTNTFGLLVGIFLGLSMTLFAVGAAMVRLSRLSIFFRIVWVLATTLDITTSIMGAIWYGAMEQPYDAPIDVESLQFDLDSWQQTGAFVVFALIIALVCVIFGRALKQLLGNSDRS